MMMTMVVAMTTMTATAVISHSLAMRNHELWSSNNELPLPTIPLGIAKYAFITLYDKGTHKRSTTLRHP